jgi:hypothetical protein
MMWFPQNIVYLKIFKYFKKCFALSNGTLEETEFLDRVHLSAWSARATLNYFLRTPMRWALSLESCDH